VKQAPHTGDTAPLFWYAMGMGAAVSAILFILVKRKKESEAE
jgi:LPXTG-motif cell wall-anchored protein